MNRSLTRWSVAITGLAVLGLASQTKAQNPATDFGTFVQNELREHSEQLFGISRPLAQSALGPYDGSDNLQAIQVAPVARLVTTTGVVMVSAPKIS